MTIGGPFRDPQRQKKKWFLDYRVPVLKDGTPTFDAEGRPVTQRMRPYYESKDKAEADKDRIRGQYASAGAGSFVRDREAQMDYERARAKLPAKVSLEMAADFWMKHHPAGEVVTIAMARERFLAHVEKVAGKERHHSDLKSRTKLFAARFGARPPGSITRAEVMDFLLTLPHEPRGKLNHKRALCTFFNWMLDDAGLIDHNPAGGIKRKKLPKVLRQEIVFLELPFVVKYLRAAERYDPDLVAHEAVQLFAGVRADDEMQDFRGEWVKAPTREVVTPAEMTKTGQREVIDCLEDNFWAWWKAYGREGVLRPANYEPRWLRVRALMQVESLARRDELARLPIKTLLKQLGRPKGWPWNARRRTFCSYHVAKHQNAAKTALILRHRGDAGTLHNSYRGTGVTKEQGEAFFAVMPATIERPILPAVARRGIVRIQFERRVALLPASA